MDFYKAYDEMKNTIKDIVSNYNFKKKKDISLAILSSVLENRMTINDLNNLKDFLLTIKFNFKEGNIFDEIKKELKKNKKINNINTFVEFFKDISQKTPTGLNQSPNAACGKYELLLFLLHKEAKQPTKGDVMIDGIKYEIKGKEIRFMNKNVSGKDYKRKMIKLHEDYGILLKGKNRNKKMITLFEPEKRMYTDKYKPIFEKNISLSKKFHKEWFNIMGFILKDEENENIHKNNKWNFSLCIKYIIIKLGESMWEQEGFDKFVLMGEDGTDIKIIENKKDLKEKVLNNKIIPQSDFFRTNQDKPIGWYIIPDTIIKQRENKKQEKIREKERTKQEKIREKERKKQERIRKNKEKERKKQEKIREKERKKKETRKNKN